MTVTKREYVFGTFVVSCISLGFLLGAMGSQNWVAGKVTIVGGATRATVEINYGLFQGQTIKRILSLPEINKVYLTCDYKENVCLVSCKTTKEARQSQITNLLKGCKNVNQLCNAAVDNCLDVETPNPNLQWFNAGVYVSNLLFLCTSIALAALSVLISIYNTARIPVEPLLGIFGLYIWNGCAAASNFLVLLLWGIHYETNLKERLSYIDIMQITPDNIESSVGISYWLILVSFFLHLISPALLYLRQWLIDREPPPPTISIDKNTDNTIFLY